MCRKALSLEVGMVVYTGGPTYLGGIRFEGSQGKLAKDLFEKQTKHSKRTWEHGSNGRALAWPRIKNNNNKMS
jgi:hypothetical protein